LCFLNISPWAVADGWFIQGNRWQMHPPPAGYEEFFAKVEQELDPFFHE
jgi:hypothetical protein